MKRCPRCRQAYANELLKFCRLDGTPLANNDVPLAEAPTIRFATRPITALIPLRLRNLEAKAVRQKPDLLEA